MVNVLRRNLPRASFVFNYSISISVSVHFYVAFALRKMDADFDISGSGFDLPFTRCRRINSFFLGATATMCAVPMETHYDCHFPLRHGINLLATSTSYKLQATNLVVNLFLNQIK